MVATWWRENRADAPTLFDDELADLIERLKVHPVLGTIHEVVDGATILKVRLRKAELEAVQFERVRPSVRNR